MHMYEQLLVEAEQLGIETYEKSLSPRLKGLYSDKIILINRNIKSNTEKTCILAEELGHYHTSSGNILDQSNIVNRKQELIARRWSYEKLVPLSKLVQAQKEGIRNRFELAQFLGITERFLESALSRYKDKYGEFATYKNYIVYFEPLGVLEMFE